MSAAPPLPAVPRRGPGCLGFLLGLALIFALLAGFIFYRLETFPARLRDAFAAVAGTQPRVTVNERVVYEQAGPVLELAVLARQMTVERESADTWLGSTKRLRVRGTFRVKAGFDLAQPFAVDVDGDWAQAVRVRLPPPRLLSVEQENVEVLVLRDGLWNRVQPEEYAEEINALNTDARLKAIGERMPAEARKLFAEQLAGKLGAGHRVDVSTVGEKPGAKQGERK